MCSGVFSWKTPLGNLEKVQLERASAHMCYLKAREVPQRILKHHTSEDPSSPPQRVNGAMALLTFPAVAYGVISEASSALFEVGARSSSVSGRNGYLATPLGAADAAGRRAGRPGTPRSHHAVDGCWESSQISSRPQRQQRQKRYVLI